MEQTIATKRRRNIGKSVTAKTRAWLLRPDVPRRQREDTIMIPAPFILPLSRSPSTQPLFSIFPNRFSHISSGERTDGRTRREQKKQKRKWLAGKIAITVPEAAENSGRQEVQHGGLGVATG